MKSTLRRKRRQLLVKLALLALVCGGVFLFLKEKKQAILRECTVFFEEAVSRQTDLSVQIGRISGHLLGLIRFEDVRVAFPLADGSTETVFECGEIRFEYGLLDYISKDGDPKLRVHLKNPKLRWSPRITLRRPNFPFFAWMRGWAMKEHRRIIVRAEGADIFYGPGGNSELKGIYFFYENNAFQIQVPVRHAEVGTMDVSSVISMEGAFQLGLTPGEDVIGGRIRTEGTIINWEPVPDEASFDFSFSRENFRVASVDFLGGINVSGGIDFLNDYETLVSFSAENYPLSNFNFLLNLGKGVSLPGRTSFDVRFHGDPLSPAVEARVRVIDGWIGRKTFKAMDVNLEGVYPTVRLENSRMLLEDGTVMRFADRTLEVLDLFREGTFRSLISDAQQDSVVWGDWEISRTPNESDQSDFLMERAFGDNARVHFKRSNDEQEVPDVTGQRREENQMEVGFEYRLKSKDSLKLELREGGEEFVGVERKLKF